MFFPWPWGPNSSYDSFFITFTFEETTRNNIQLLVCGGWCHGEEEARALKEEVHSRLSSVHCWVMILHRPRGQHAASRQLCVSVYVWDRMVCVSAWGRNGVSDTRGKSGGGELGNDLRLPLTAVCICVLSAAVTWWCVWVCVCLPPSPQVPLWPALYSTSPSVMCR